MKIGEVAAKASVNVQTIRYYERCGMLPVPARLASGYRTYSAGIVRLIQFIKQSQELGFTLDEIKRLLWLRSHTQTGNGREVRALAESKIQSIDDRIRGLKRVRAELKSMLDTCLCGTEAQPDCPGLQKLDSFGS